MNSEIILKSRPKGKPTLDTFEFKDIDKPEPKNGEVLLKTLYVSVDPYLRGRMRDEESYIPSFKVGEPISSGIIAEVTESKNDNFKKGDFVSGMLSWKKWQTHSGKGLQKVDKDKAKLSAYLGILGMTGMTAYLGLENIGNPKEGETLLVSGASGAVGSTVGQIGKIKGCRVVGIAGTDEKIGIIQNKFGFDAGINYKTTDDMTAAIKDSCPDGVDVYYDNVGGKILDAAMKNIARNGRVVNCGAIASYNDQKVPTGPRYESILIKKSVKMQGFTIGDFEDQFQEAQEQLAQWLQEGKMDYEETIVEGFDNIPQAFLDLFEGKNKGKMVVKV